MTGGWENGTDARLLPIVTPAETIDAVELARTSIRRWPLQEKIVRDVLWHLAWIRITALARPHGQL